MTCSNCGYIQQENLIASVKSIICPTCGAEMTPDTKEGWMRYSYLKQTEVNVQENPHAQKIEDLKILSFESLETDNYGRTYAELQIQAVTSKDSTSFRMAVCFLDVTDHAPCQVILPTVLLLPGLFMESQRKKAKKKFGMGTPRQ